MMYDYFVSLIYVMETDDAGIFVFADCRCAQEFSCCVSTPTPIICCFFFFVVVVSLRINAEHEILMNPLCVSVCVMCGFCMYAYITSDQSGWQFT